MEHKYYSRILNIYYVVVKVKQKALFWAFSPNIMQLVYWESVLKVRNSGLMLVFVEADIIISVCNFDQSTASSPLTANAAVT